MKLFGEAVVSALMLGLVGVSSGWLTQDQEEEKIEIVNQDGEKVELKIRQEGGAKASQDIRVQDGKVIIVHGDGTRQELDTSGAQSIVVNKSVQSVSKNGEEQKKVVGKAIVIGPNGERQVIELGDGAEFPMIGDFGAKFGLPGNIVFGNSGNAGKFMIGVSCRPASDALRAHLDLAKGIGLSVEGDPAKDSPAGKAGIKKHDILMYADQEELTSVEKLVEAVGLAGKENRELTLTFLRRGKEKTADVKPVERKLATWQAGFPGMSVDIEEFGPAIVFDREEGLPADLLKRMEAFELRMQERMDQIQDRLLRELSDEPIEEDDD